MHRKLILYILILFLLVGCEETIQFDSKTDKRLTVYALAVSGQQFNAYISQSKTITDGPNFYYLEFSDFSRETLSYFSDSLVVRNANAILTVNGTERYKLSFVSDSLYYKCDYVPQSGDRLVLEVEATGFPTVTSQCSVKEPIALTGISNYVYYNQAASREEHEWMKQWFDYDTYGADSISTITFTFHDPIGEKNFYRLRVRSVGEYYSFGQKHYSVCDVFTSSDPVFNDRQLTKGYGSWEPYFSNVFDDAVFNGKDYTITVNSRNRAENPCYTILELQSISQELYYFLKSMQLYRISTDDVYQTPIGLYSNVANGWGIVGTISCDRHIIYY